MQRSGQKHKAHQLARSRFSTFVFQLSGCKFLLHTLIELPIIPQIESNSVGQPVATVLEDSNSVGQPVATVLEDLISSYEKHKDTPQYCEFREAVPRYNRQRCVPAWLLLANVLPTMIRVPEVAHMIARLIV